MSTTTKRRILAGVAMTLLLAAGTAGSASAADASATGSVSVFVPAALSPHQLCVSTRTTGRTCKAVPGVPATTLTVTFAAHAAVAPPSAAVTPCGEGAVVTIDGGGGSLSGDASVSALTLSAVSLAIPTTAPGEAVAVEFCT